jgi:serine/threonine protein phosphatase PrpC
MFQRTDTDPRVPAPPRGGIFPRASNPWSQVPTDPHTPAHPAPPTVAAHPELDDDSDEATDEATDKPEVAKPTRWRPRTKRREYIDTVGWAALQIQGAREQQEDSAALPFAVGSRATKRSKVKAILSAGEGQKVDLHFGLHKRGELMCGVFDGLGGHELGREHAIAAATVVETLGLVAAPTEPARPLLARITRAAAEQLSKSYPRSRGDTTATLALIDRQSGSLVFSQVGDSAVLRLRGGAVELLTPMHNSPFANHVLDRTLKVHGQDTQDHGDETRGATVSFESARAGDVFLVCTDGFHGAVTVPDLAAATREAFADLDDDSDKPHPSPEARARHIAVLLMEKVLAKRDPRQDNATLIVLYLPHPEESQP